jgi:ribonuclease BN (tRNA processing enzyme)
MKLVLLGTTGYHPNERGHTPCMLLPECGVMLDAGTAMFRAPRYLRTRELHIFLSHVHLDHVVGLSYLLNIVRIHPLDRIVVYGEPDKLVAINEHLFSTLLFPKKPPMEMRPLEHEVPLPQAGRLTHFPLEHNGGTIGFRLEWPDHSMAYVTDVTASPSADYVRKIRGVNLLIHECYFSDEHADWAKKTCHSCTTPVAQVARKAGVGRLVLVHLNPLSDADDPVGLDTARAIFPRTLLGEDLMELEF